MKNLSAWLSLGTISLMAAGAARADDPAAKAPPGAEAGKAAPAEAGKAPAAVVGPPTVAWKDLTKEQKGKFMKAVVMPKMRPLFTAFDPKEFKKVDCATCHGKDAKAREFKMPNADIFVLPANKEGFAALMEKKPKWMKFMGETVKPQMAAVLGLPEFSPAKPEAGGFGCMQCHTMKAP